MLAPSSLRAEGVISIVAAPGNDDAITQVGEGLEWEALAQGPFVFLRTNPSQAGLSK